MPSKSCEGAGGTGPVARALARLRKTTGVDLTFCGVPEANALRLSIFDGAVAGPLRGAALDAGHGLGGRVLVQQRSIALRDYVSAPTILHTYDSIIRAELLHAMVAAPVIVGRQVTSVVYAAARLPQNDLGRLFDAVTAEARALEQSLAVEAALAVRAADVDVSDARSHQLRAAYLELREIATTISDSQLQSRIRAAADKIVDESPGPATAAVHLTAREHDVLELMANGNSNAAIAEQLGIGVYTVKGHVKNLMAKLGARNRFESVVHARRMNVLA
nr:LuxR C-terminal-related transcriptional regulator [Rhodococcus sp. (in: high G+C Gram-positive bacteria)]